METKPGVRAQTLDRALDVLDILADGQARSSQDLAAATGLHRSIVYRILRTLEDRELVRRTTEGRYTMGLGLLVLTRSVLGETQAQLHDVLAELANSVGATAFFAVPRAGQVVTLVTVEPDRDRAGVAAYRPWTRAPMDRGACGLAIQSASPARPDERPEIGWARQTGVVRTVGELHPGLTELAAPVRFAEGTVGCVAVVFVAGEISEDKAADAVRRTAIRLTRPADEVWEI
ncbi:hypothetical protein GCM10023214_71630 [Amycolatopsis dongchuanensis]|uniref:DNA-binding transcriptional regulator, IclR family n=2 Tax=Amycolatopsis TaxID=1813 RepID=A0A1I3MTE7_9PSEU|nr:DNA-binding transcriptional regulator, IclR family [Amycolatopsis sacchari]